MVGQSPHGLFQSLLEALHLLSLRVVHLLLNLNLLRKIKQTLQIESWSVSPPSLLARCNQPNPPGLPPNYEEIYNILFLVVLFFLAPVPQETRRQRFW